MAAYLLAEAKRLSRTARPDGATLGDQRQFRE